MDPSNNAPERKKKELEQEIAVYANMTARDGLAQANEIKVHNQEENRYIDETRCRVRKTTKAQQVKFEYTTKVDAGQLASGITNDNEKTVNVDEPYFLLFCETALRAIKKTRYTFFANELHLVINGQDVQLEVPYKFEVDVFTRHHDKQQDDWVKIDIELTEINRVIAQKFPNAESIKYRFKISELPIAPKEFFFMKQATPEQKAFISQKWEKDFAFHRKPDPVHAR